MPAVAGTTEKNRPTSQQPQQGGQSEIVSGSGLYHAATLCHAVWKTARGVGCGHTYLELFDAT
jgi:hypothetical protein